MPPPHDPANNGFTEYKRLILDTQERLDRSIAQLNKRIESILIDDLSQIKTDVTLLKYKAGLWGSVSGSIGGALFGAILTFLIKLYFR
jgi:hypothetical protein